MSDLHAVPDMQWLLSEARIRWLQADEITQMLSNHLALPISKKAPLLPCSGSVFFYDRRKTRYFRRDGLEWKKRSDGKTINEAHEKLKVGAIDRLNCYYARGEENPNFQRRCYSMLEATLMHNVFVHYLDVKITCTSRTLSSPAVRLERPSSLLGLLPDDRNEIFKQTLRDSSPGKKLKPSCPYSRHQSEKPPWGEAEMQLATTQLGFGNGTGMASDINLTLTNSDSPSYKGHFNHLQDDFPNSATTGFSFSYQEGVGPLENEKMLLLDCLPQVYSVPDTPSAENSDGRNAFASKHMSVCDYPSIFSRGSDDHGFQDMEASGLGNSSSIRFLEETSTHHFPNINFWHSDINEDDFSTSTFADLHQSEMPDDLEILMGNNDFSTSPFAGLHQSDMSEDMQVLLGTIDFGPSDSNEEEFSRSPFQDPHQSSMSDDLQFDEVLYWRARRRWTKLCGAVKFLAVWKSAALKKELS